MNGGVGRLGVLSTTRASGVAGVVPVCHLLQGGTHVLGTRYFSVGNWVFVFSFPYKEGLFRGLPFTTTHT